MSPELRRIAAALAAVALVLGCGAGDNSLSGSLGEVFSLDVSTVHVLRNDEAFAVSYEANNGQSIDLVLRFTLALDGVNISPGRTVDLRGMTDGGVVRATFIHQAAGEPTRVLPAVSVGEFSLDEGGNPGQVTSGSFNVSFVNDGSYGSGRGVSGRFHGTALDAGFGDWIP